jgi:hypothetical protein
MAKQDKIETLTINDVEYVRKDSIKQAEPLSTTVVVKEGDSVATAFVGKFVIVRSRNEGINAGTVEAADNTGIVLKDCRRLYYHRPSDTKLSWYEGVAVTGLSNNSKCSGTVGHKAIVEDYSITECTPAAEASIMEHTPNAQN